MCGHLIHAQHCWLYHHDYPTYLWTIWEENQGERRRFTRGTDSASERSCRKLDRDINSSPKQRRCSSVVRGHLKWIEVLVRLCLLFPPSFYPLRNHWNVNFLPRRQPHPFPAWRQHLRRLLHRDASFLLQISLSGSSFKEEQMFANMARQPNRSGDASDWIPWRGHECSQNDGFTVNLSIIPDCALKTIFIGIRKLLWTLEYWTEIYYLHSFTLFKQKYENIFSQQS